MSNTNIEHIGIVKNTAFYIDQPDRAIPMTPEEEIKSIENINIAILDNILEVLEKEIDNPSAWISFEEAMDDIRREILSE